MSKAEHDGGNQEDCPDRNGHVRQGTEYESSVEKLFADSCRNCQTAENGGLAAVVRKDSFGQGFDVFRGRILGKTNAAQIEPVSQAKQSRAENSNDQKIGQGIRL